MGRSDGGSDPNLTAGLLGLAGGLAYVLQGLLSVVSAIFGVLSSLYSLLPFLIVALVVTAIYLPITIYGSSAIEQGELALRSTVYPIYRDDVRPFLNFLRSIYDILVCWYNSIVWWSYGVIREVIWPVVRMCGVRDLLRNTGYFIKYLGFDLILHIVSGAFFRSDADFSRISPAGIAMFTSLDALFTCTCSDLSQIVSVIPIVSPLWLFPPAIPLSLFSEQFVDSETWCAIDRGTNAFLALVADALTLVQQVLYLIFGQPIPGGIFIRPDLRTVVDRLCPAISCIVRSYENILQRLFDLYIPFKFVFHRYLCIIDSLVCIGLKTFALLFRILVNIDQCVLYPVSPYWRSVILPDMIEILNLIAPPTQFPTIQIPEVRY